MIDVGGAQSSPSVSFADNAKSPGPMWTRSESKTSPSSENYSQLLEENRRLKKVRKVIILTTESPKKILKCTEFLEDSATDQLVIVVELPMDHSVHE